VSGTCASVPILPGAIPVVEVTIGGKGPYKFAIDTGAQGAGRISTALAEELKLPKVGEVGTPAPGGSVATRPVYGAPEISVGAVSFKNVDLVALSTVRGSDGEWDGILGNELLELLPLTLDYGNARARFGGPGLREGLPVRFDRGIPVLPVEIAGQRFEVHFDSGNGAGGLFLDEDKAKALPLGGAPVERGPRAHELRRFRDHGSAADGLGDRRRGSAVDQRDRLAEPAARRQPRLAGDGGAQRDARQQVGPRRGRTLGRPPRCAR
jgi:predicted aspartyl protease